MATVTQAGVTTARQARLYAGGQKRAERFVLILSYTVLILGAITMLAPFFWMLATSLKDPKYVFTLPPNFIPNPLVLDNYVKVFQQTDMLRGFLNSLFIAVVSTAGEVFFSLLGGFAFARLQFPGRGFFFGMLLATMAIPPIVTLVPSFLLFRSLKWLDTFLPLIVPPLLGTAFAVFLSRQFFATLPGELIDAARVDGANYFQVFIKIYVPLAKPVMLTLIVLGFIARWNDFFGPLIYLSAVDKFPVQLMLSRLNGAYQQQWTLLMAGAVLAVLPCITLFFFMQKYFIEGVALTGMKG